MLGTFVLTPNLDARWLVGCLDGCLGLISMLSASSRASTSADINIPHVEVDLSFGSLWEHGYGHRTRVYATPLLIRGVALPSMAACFVLEDLGYVFSGSPEDEDARPLI